MSKLAIRSVLSLCVLSLVGVGRADTQTGRDKCCLAVGCREHGKTAQCSKCPSTTISLTSACSGSKCDSTACADCPIAAAMKKLPHMTFVVDGQKTGCAESAREWAAKSDHSIHFVVAEKTYHCEEAAKQALLAATEQHVAALLEPQVCEKSGTTTVAGKTVCCGEAADERVASLKAALDKVHLTYWVGQKSCQCPHEAAKVAEQTKEPTVYAVGQQKTSCELTARLDLVRAKYKAAVEAIAKLDDSQPVEKR